MKRALLFLFLASCGSDETTIATIPKKGSGSDDKPSSSIACAKASDCPENNWCSIGDAGAGTCKPCVKGEPGCEPVTGW